MRTIVHFRTKEAQDILMLQNHELGGYCWAAYHGERYSPLCILHGGTSDHELPQLQFFVLQTIPVHSVFVLQALLRMSYVAALQSYKDHYLKRNFQSKFE